MRVECASAFDTAPSSEAQRALCVSRRRRRAAGRLDGAQQQYDAVRFEARKDTHPNRQKKFVLQRPVSSLKQVCVCVCV